MFARRPQFGVAHVINSISVDASSSILGIKTFGILGKSESLEESDRGGGGGGGGDPFEMMMSLSYCL